MQEGRVLVQVTVCSLCLRMDLGGGRKGEGSAKDRLLSLLE